MAWGRENQENALVVGNRLDHPSRTLADEVKGYTKGDGDDVVDECKRSDRPDYTKATSVLPMQDLRANVHFHSVPHESTGDVANVVNTKHGNNNLLQRGSNA